MVEERALQRGGGDDELPHRVEILARLLFVPGCGARRELLEAHRGALRMTRITARMTRPFGQENRLDPRLEEVVVERWRSWTRSGRLLPEQRDHPNQCDHHQAPPRFNAG